MALVLGKDKSAVYISVIVCFLRLYIYILFIYVFLHIKLDAVLL